MVPLARGPSSDDPAPNTTSRQILWVRRHRSQSVRKDGDIVIADNLGAHKVAGIQRAIQAAGATL